MMPAIDDKTFVQDLHEALVHLHDPDYRPADSLRAPLGCGPKAGALDVQAALARAIEALEPPPGAPPTAHAGRIHDVLHARFVLRLTQEETAERLHVSVSTVQRAQREAVHALAALLWERLGTAENARGTLAPDWPAQVEHELASLRSRDPDSVANVAETLAGVLEMAATLSPGREVEVEYVQPELVADVHPSALRQMLIAAMARLARHAAPGPITVFARLQDGNTSITVRGPIAAGGVGEEQLTRDVLVPDGGSVSARVEGGHAFLRIDLPSPDRVNVLIVDDNPDAHHFYRRCTTGTRYRILHAQDGEAARRAVAFSPPDVIVLDVMLPDTDGWQLLMQWRENLETRTIPIIVCSVVKEEELARSLGAALYLSKPVDPPGFVRALDRVCPPGRVKDEREPVSSTAPP